MAIRTVTGQINTPTGQPWAGFVIEFTIAPSTYTAAATYPQQTVETTTEADGTFSIDLETDITYRVGLRGAYIISGSSTRYPSGTQFEIVVPDGPGSISLETIRALDPEASGFGLSGFGY